MPDARGEASTPADATAPPRVVIVTPAPRGSPAGNRVTALRWAALLRQLGARVRVRERFAGEPCDLLIAVHAVKSADSVLAAAAALPAVRIVVLLAGTDVYPRFAPDAATMAALDRADVLIGLQPHAQGALPPHLRGSVRTIVQSARAWPAARGTTFRAAVLAHLRPVKDPLLPVRALRYVPAGRDFELLLAGRVLTPSLADEVRCAMAAEPRLRWLGELRRRAARELLASSHVCIVPSSAEGGPNVISEAIAAGTPVLATAIPGNLGLLGADWPGCFATGDAQALGALLTRAATDAAFYALLRARTAALLPMVDPRRERDAFRQLLQDLHLLR